VQKVGGGLKKAFSKAAGVGVISAMITRSLVGANKILLRQIGEQWTRIAKDI
jgi:Flp pilus assembly pilin Flp